MALGMNIQYGNMNPLQELPDRIAQGIGLGLAIRRQNREEEVSSPANLPIQNPGQRPQVDIQTAMQPEVKDNAKYKNMMQHLNKIKDPELKEEAKRNIPASSGVTSDIVYEAMRSGINPSDVEYTLDKVSSQSPDAQFYVNSLIGQSGGKNSNFAKAIIKKQSEIQQAQNSLDRQYSIKLRSAITQIEEAKENPQKYAKKGQAHESVMIGLQNEGNYLATLAQLSSEDAKWVEQYLARQQQKRGGGSGGRMTHFEGLTKDNKKVYGTYATAQDFMADKGAVKITGQIGYTTPQTQILGKAEVNAENQKDEFGFTPGEARQIRDKNGKITTLYYQGNDNWDTKPLK